MDSGERESLAGTKRNQSDVSHGDGEQNFYERSEKRVASYSSTAPSNQEIVFRILCPSKRIGSVIGKGGSVVKLIRSETKTRIKVSDALPRVDERVVVISGVDSRDQQGLCPAQEALLRIHSRIFDVGDEEVSAQSSITTRLLVPRSQIGCILGKGGSIVAKLRADSGAQIRVLQRDEIPVCALPTDELLAIVGDFESSAKALQIISSQLRDNPPKGEVVTFASFAAPPPFTTNMLPPPQYSPNQILPAQVPMGQWQLYPAQPMAPMAAYPREPESKEVVIQCLCHVNRIGRVIGRGGSIIEQLRDSSGAKIRVADALEGGDERVVIASGREVPGTMFSPAQEAILMVQNILMGKDADSVDGCGAFRLLIPTARIGCLIGKGGAVISALRSLTNTNIRILPKDQMPASALKDDEVVQLFGTAECVRSALLEVLTRLRADILMPPGPDETNGVDPSDFRMLSSHFSEQSLPPPPPAAHTLIQTIPTTMFVAVPCAVISPLLVNNGARIEQIKSLSGANVKLHEAQPNSSEQFVEFFGLPDQLTVAQSLLHSFLGQGNPSAIGH